MTLKEPPTAGHRHRHKRDLVLSFNGCFFRDTRILTILDHLYININDKKLPLILIALL